MKVDHMNRREFSLKKNWMKNYIVNIDRSIMKIVRSGDISDRNMNKLKELILDRKRLTDEYKKFLFTESKIFDKPVQNTTVYKFTRYSRRSTPDNH